MEDIEYPISVPFMTLADELETLTRERVAAEYRRRALEHCPWVMQEEGVA